MVLKFQEEVEFGVSYRLQIEPDLPITLITACGDVLRKGDPLKFLCPLDLSDFGKKRTGVEARRPKYIAVAESWRSQDVFYYCSTVSRLGDIH
jgi:hypothetical protein